MNLDPLSINLSQISYLIKNLSKRNCKSTVQEIIEIVSSQGQEADRYLLRCLLSEIDFNSDAIRVSSNKDFQHIQLLIQSCTVLLRKPSFVSLFVYAVDKTLRSNNIKNPTNLLPTLSKILKLTAVQEVVFGLTLLHSSYQSISESALYFIKQKLPLLIRNYSNEDKHEKVPEGGLRDSTPEVLHFILSYLLFPKESTFLGIDCENRDLFLKSLRRDFPKQLVPVVLSPILYPDRDYNFSVGNINCNQSNAMASNSVDEALHTLIREVGYAFCATIEDGRTHMNALGMRDLSPSVVARILIMMVRTTSGIDELGCSTFFNPDQNSDKSVLDNSSQNKGWNVEVFVQLLKEYNPHLSWVEVIKELDNGDLIIKERKSLSLLFTTLRLGLQHQGYHHDQFPVELFYRRWKHADSQLSLITQILKNPDVFCFADYAFHSVPLEGIKMLPDNDNKEIAVWHSINLIEILLYIAERGFASQVQDLLKFPMQHCPDILILGLTQTNQPATFFRQELISSLLHLFLTNHPNSGFVLHKLWSSQNQTMKQITMTSMAEWYIRADGDPTRLSRILDIAIELKALTLLLNVQTYPFVIDLACLASRREYLKLEKWLTDKVRDHGEGFILALIKFVQRRCPHIFGTNFKDEVFSKGPPISQDAVIIIVNCLQACLGNVGPELNESIVSIVANCNIYLNKVRAAAVANLQTNRNIEPSVNRTLFASGNTQVDPLINLGNTINLNANGPQISNNAFNLPGSLGPLASNSGSPSRLISPAQNTSFAFLPQLSGTMNSQVNHVPSPLINNNMATIGSLTHMAPQPSPLEKLRLSEPPAVTTAVEFSSQISKDVEDEANSYFQRIFNHPPNLALTTDEVIEMLKKFHHSSHKREREVFVCMIRNLFEEYKFFSQYPEKELFITAQLFGGILAQGLLAQSPLFGTGLKYIVDALRKPGNTKMYSFGVAALDQLKPILKDIPKLCDYILKLPSFQDLPASIIESIEYGIQGQEPPHKATSTSVPTLLSSPLFKSSVSASGTPTSSAATKIGANARPSIATATNIDTLLVATEKDEKMIMPPESVQEKVAFIFNNLSQLNIQVKSDEIREVMREEHFGWLAQYMVMKRASIEFNFHALYSNFLDTLKLSEFDRYVLTETYRNIKVLLRCDKSTANFSDRTLLKNLGHWLGMITLAKDKPILMDDLDVRMLLVESQKKGSQEMLYVVPFVAKMMDSCTKSKVFKPPNPWTMSVIYLLGEIHQEPGLKLNLKFEVEVLLKSLQLDLKNLDNTNYLKESDLIKHMENQLTNKDKTPSPSPVSTPVASQSLTPSSQNNASSVILSNGTSSSCATPSLVNNNTNNSNNSNNNSNNNNTNNGLSNEELMLQMTQMSINSAATSSNSLLTPVPLTPEPKYNLANFNISTTSALGALLIVNPQLPLFQTYPALKHYVRPIVESCLQQWLQVSVDRALKISIITSEVLIKNDFALDPEESRIRAAAHYMVRNITAAVAILTCREQITNSFLFNLKTTFLNILTKSDNNQYPSAQQKEMTEHAVNVCVTDNLDLVCAFVQKTAADKGIAELDRRLTAEYEKRKSARSEGRRYCDSGVLTYQAERMPEQVRLKVGGVSQYQMAVYEEFFRSVPGFQQLTEREVALFTSKQQLPQPLFAAGDESPVVYDKLILELEMYLHAMSMHGLMASGNGNTSSQASNVQSSLECLMTLKRSSSRDSASAAAILQKAVDGLLENVAQAASDPDNLIRYREFYARILKTFQDNRGFGINWTSKTIGNLTSLIEKLKVGSTNNSSSSSSSSIASSSDYSSVSATPYIHSAILQTRECDDPPGLTDKIEMLLREWMNSYEGIPLTKDHSKPFGSLVHQLNVNGLLKTDDLMTRFFRHSIHVVIDVYYRALKANEMNSTGRVKVFHTLDAYARLMSMLVKHSGDAANTTTKLNLLNKILGIIAGVMLQDCEQRGVEFYQLPYHRIFSMLFMELTFADRVLDGINFAILQAFAHTYHILRPSKAPAFAYAWLELVSHRLFINRVLSLTPNQKGWSMYAQLMIDLFKFLAPFLRNAELAKPVSTLYKGTLRVLLVLLHDFPEFLCDYHYSFCDVVPPNCIQLRNLILSAFPRSMRLPDPFTPNLKVDVLPEIATHPRILPNYVTSIVPPSFRKDLETYLKQRAPASFPSEMRSVLRITDEAGSKYNMQLVNAVVLYVGAQAIADLRARNTSPNTTTIAYSAHMDIFQSLAGDLDPEGRYVFFNAIVNQLRYPNSHTHYFSCTLLYLFAEANAEVIQEQITRILLERIIVNRPHPWGLLITFIELIKNPNYKFWDHDFVHCAPEIEKLFESVANSCMGRKAVPAVLVETEVTEG